MYRRHFGIGRILRAISAHCAAHAKATHMLTRGSIYLHVDYFACPPTLIIRAHAPCALFLTLQDYGFTLITSVSGITMIAKSCTLLLIPLLLLPLIVLFFFSSGGTAFHSSTMPSKSATSSIVVPLTSETVNNINESEPSKSKAESKESESSTSPLALPEATNNDPTIPSIKLGGMLL